MTNGGKLLNPSPSRTQNEVGTDRSPAPISSLRSPLNVKPGSSSNADPKNRGKERAGGWQITVALVEKALGAAKVVLDNFSIPGAVPAIDGILSVITAAKVRVFIVSAEWSS